MHTYIHTYVHTYIIHTCIHTHIHIHAYMHTYIYTHTCIHTYAHSTYIHTYIHTHIRVHAVLNYIHNTKMLYVATNNFSLLQDLLNVETMNYTSCSASLEKICLELYPAISSNNSGVTEQQFQTLSKRLSVHPSIPQPQYAHGESCQVSWTFLIP